MTIMIGIDPHKASHTAVAIDNNEVILDELRVRACAKQTEQLRLWASPFPDRVWAVGDRVRARPGLSPRPTTRRRRRDCRGRAGGAVDTHQIVGLGQGTEERPQRRPIGRDRRVAPRRAATRHRRRPRRRRGCRSTMLPMLPRPVGAVSVTLSSGLRRGRCRQRTLVPLRVDAAWSASRR